MKQGAEIGALQQPRGVGGGSEVQEGEDICIPVADSCYWMTTDNTHRQTVRDKALIHNTIKEF